MKNDKGEKVHRQCKKEKGESVVPDERMNLLNLTDAMDQKWIEWLEPQVKLSRNAIVKKD